MHCGTEMVRETGHVQCPPFYSHVVHSFHSFHGGASFFAFYLLPLTTFLSSFYSFFHPFHLLNFSWLFLHSFFWILFIICRSLSSPIKYANIFSRSFSFVEIKTILKTCEPGEQWRAGIELKLSGEGNRKINSIRTWKYVCSMYTL